MAERGHEVIIYTFTTGTPDDYSWFKTKIRSYHEYEHSDKTQFDVIMAWMGPDFLYGIPSGGPLRVVDQQLNDFGYCKPGWEQFVDVVGGLSETHTDYLKTCAPGVPDHKWESFYNGLDPLAFEPCEKISGRVIYASSPDRGLHLLLQQWPRIRQMVPNAILRVFYNFDPWIAHLRSLDLNHVDAATREQAHRAFYINESMHRLHDHGIEHFKSVGRKRIAREMSEAQVLAYPCDPVRWTEGFSNTLMEACYAGAAPVTSDVDALGQLYGGAAISIHDIRNNLDEFTDGVVKLLTDESYRQIIVDRCKKRAESYFWPRLAERLESILMRRMTIK
jgi:glycosyltransferase involved in cell wall biosynthesis